jgi:hypothetical protein
MTSKVPPSDAGPERLPGGRFLSRKDGSSHQARGEKTKADNGRRTAPEHLELAKPDRLALWRRQCSSD